MTTLPTIAMTASELNALPEYSCSLPTSLSVGKRWRRNLSAFAPRFVDLSFAGIDLRIPVKPVWFVAEVCRRDDATNEIRWSRVVVLDEDGASS